MGSSNMSPSIQRFTRVCKLFRKSPGTGNRLFRMVFDYIGTSKATIQRTEEQIRQSFTMQISEDLRTSWYNLFVFCSTVYLIFVHIGKKH